MNTAVIVSKKRTYNTTITDAIKSNEVPNEDFKRISSGLNVLDLGCGNCHYWYELYRVIHFKQIIGIDKVNQELIAAKTFEQESIRGKKYVAAGSYEHYLGESQLHNTKAETQLSEEEFYTIFKKQTNTSWDLFGYVDDAKSKHTKFDFVIISNVLHLTEIDKSKRENLLTTIHKIIEEIGYLYIYASKPDFVTGNLKFERNEVVDILKPHFKSVATLNPARNTYSLLFKRS